jgi:hypothetical protein
MRNTWAGIVFGATLAICLVDVYAEDKLRFNRDVLPILAEYCSADSIITTGQCSAKSTISRTTRTTGSGTTSPSTRRAAASKSIETLNNRPRALLLVVFYMIF